MLLQTKIFNFEMAHAIFGYPGDCKNIHGHSYELHVTVSPLLQEPGYLPAPGFVLDFKALKEMVRASIIATFDHKLVLSQEYLAMHPALQSSENLVAWEAEPTAENMLVYIQSTLVANLPANIRLLALKLYETASSYASWVNTESAILYI